MQMFAVDDIQVNAEVTDGKTAEAQTAAEADSNDSMTNIQTSDCKMLVLTGLSLWNVVLDASFAQIKELNHGHIHDALFVRCFCAAMKKELFYCLPHEMSFPVDLCWL